MRSFQLGNVVCCMFPLAILLAGIVHIHPAADAEFQRLRQHGQRDVQRLGELILSCYRTNE